MSYYQIISPKRWTQSAIDCYFIGCVCAKCTLYEIMGNRCRMKYTVIELVKKFGKPKRILTNEKSD